MRCEARRSRTFRSAPLGALGVALLLALADPLAAQEETVGFSGSVRSSELYPLASALVSLPALDRSAITNAQGEFHFRGLPTGRHEVMIEFLGLTSHATIELEPGTFAYKHYQLDISLAELEPIRVETEAIVHSRLREFARRAATEAGRYFDRAAIDERAVMRPGDLLPDLVGVRVADEGAGSRQYSIGRGPRNCPPNLFIDGAPVTVFSVDEFYTENIEAVEVYKSFAQTPIQYRSDNLCGAIIIWTREKSR